MADHTITHIEIPVQDPITAGTFYTDLFGWKVFKDEQFNIHFFQTSPTSGGGFTQVNEESADYGTKPGQVLIYVNTDDMDATLAKAASLGAKIAVPKMEIPGMGWSAVFVDPTGNHIGLWQGLNKE
jgi:uncharacterized protein